jgi:hypothetical protein
VNLILQTFRTVDYIQYEHFRPFTVPERPTFLTFSGLKKAENAHGSLTNGQERLGTFEPGRSNALENIHVHASKTKK